MCPDLVTLRVESDTTVGRIQTQGVRSALPPEVVAVHALYVLYVTHHHQIRHKFHTKVMSEKQEKQQLSKYSKSDI